MKRVSLLLIALAVLCFGCGKEAFAEVDDMTLADANAACAAHGGYQTIGDAFGCAWCNQVHCFVITCKSLNHNCTYTVLPPSVKSVGSGSSTIGNAPSAPPTGGKPEKPPGNAAPIGKPVGKVN